MLVCETTILLSVWVLALIMFNLVSITLPMHKRVFGTINTAVVFVIAKIGWCLSRPLFFICFEVHLVPVVIKLLGNKIFLAFCLLIMDWVTDWLVLYNWISHWPWILYQLQLSVEILVECFSSLMTWTGLYWTIVVWINWLGVNRILSVSGLLEEPISISLQFFKLR